MIKRAKPQAWIVQEKRANCSCRLMYCRREERLLRTQHEPGAPAESNGLPLGIELDVSVDLVRVEGSKRHGNIAVLIGSDSVHVARKSAGYIRHRKRVLLYFYHIRTPTGSNEKKFIVCCH